MNHRNALVEELRARIHRNVMRALDGKNRAEICRKAGLPESSLSAQIKKGRYTLELLGPLADALGMTLGELLDPPERDIPPRKASELLSEISLMIERAKR